MRNSMTETPMKALEAQVERCRVRILNSKKAAAEIACEAYAFWRETDAPGARGGARDWLQLNIDLSNRAIVKHNDAEKALRARAAAFANGTLKSNDRIFKKNANAADKKAIATDKSRLTALASLTNGQWTARGRLPIEARKNAPPFNRVLKYLFNGDARHDDISRYGRALEWLHDQFEGKQVAAVSVLAKLFDAAGGFEAVIEHQRAKAPKQLVHKQATPTLATAQGSIAPAIHAAIPVIAETPTLKSGAAPKLVAPMSAHQAQGSVVSPPLAPPSERVLKIEVVLPEAMLDLPTGPIAIHGDYADGVLHVSRALSVSTNSGAANE